MQKLITVIMCLVLSGCGAAQYTANTTASVGLDRGFSYSSNKNQENLKAKGTLEAGKLSFEVETTATTPESAIAAALQTNLELLKLLNSAMAAGLAAGTKGVPVK